MKKKSRIDKPKPQEEQKKNQRGNRSREKHIASHFFRAHARVIVNLLRTHRASTLGIMILSLVLLSSEYIDLKMLEYLTNSVSSSVNDASLSKTLLMIGVFIAALFVIRVLTWIYNRLMLRFKSVVSAEVESKINSKLSSVKYEYYESNAFYEKINLARQASEQYPTAVSSISTFFNIFVRIIVYGWMLAQISIIYVLVIFVSVFLSAVIAAAVTNKQLEYWEKHVSPESRRKSYFGGIFADRVNHQNIQTARTFPYFQNKYECYIAKERKNYIKLNILSLITELASSVMFLAAFYFTAIIVGKGVVVGEFEIGYFTMVVAMLANLFTSIKSYAMLIMNRSWYVKTLDAYEDVIQYDEFLQKINKNGANSLSLKGVKYKYMQSDEYALDGIDLEIKEGEKIALVGENGCGKTTLISIILGLLENYEGKYDCGSFACGFMPVFQDFGQYQMTVKENLEIGCGGTELSDEDTTKILETVGLLDYISSLPDGINTKLGQLDNGVGLSKGQWQRLAIGRLLANPKATVWILDEPTAYLDPIAEIEMYKTVFELAGDRLVVFISHRLGFAKYADRIVVVKDGKIAEQGTHSELIGICNGYYANMYAAQKSWYD